MNCYVIVIPSTMNAYSLSFIVPMSIAALPHRQPASPGTSHVRCCDQRNDTKDPLSRKSKKAIIFSSIGFFLYHL
jgi:hypothetical protein